MENIEKIIKEFTHIKDLDNIIKKCEKRKWQLINEAWEYLYAERCKETYLTPREVCDKFKWHNLSKYKEGDLYNKLMNHYYENPFGISELLYHAKFLEVSVPSDVAKMVCKACTCGRCPDQEECAGFTCDKCKEANYTKYQWECEE